MVVSTNNTPTIGEFKNLLSHTLTSLEADSKKNSKNYLLLSSHKLEEKVEEILKFNSSGTVFENTIELISGQRFPDIVAKKYYGIEVKSTKSNHWKSTGSSIAEGTRVDGVERIFMLFGKLCNPIEFKCKPYEACLSEVVVTHSPRYLINMDLEKGQTIFDKLKIPYDKLRKQENPIKTVLNYYKKQLKPGEETWWLDPDLSQSTSLIIRIWNNLSDSEREEYKIKGFCYFPELLSNHPTKFNKFSIWLSTQEGVVCPNVRDIFTAGGQGSFKFETYVYKYVPQIIIKLLNNISKIKEIINDTDEKILSEYWGKKVKAKNKHEIWCELMIENIKTIYKSFPSKILYL